MRIHGTLVKWNDARGFGFVALPQSHEEIFVHVSAFPRDGARPRIGETISFEVRSGPDGRKRAEGVERPGGRTPVRSSRNVPRVHRRTPRRTAFATVVLGVLAALGYSAYSSRGGAAHEAVLPTPEFVEASAQQFKCDGRTHCSQMTSCAEASYFLQHCPNTQMDGDNDGEPCEQQWCN